MKGETTCSLISKRSAICPAVIQRYFEPTPGNLGPHGIFKLVYDKAAIMQGGWFEVGGARPGYTWSITKS